MHDYRLVEKQRLKMKKISCSLDIARDGLVQLGLMVDHHLYINNQNRYIIGK